MHKSSFFLLLFFAIFPNLSTAQAPTKKDAAAIYSDIQKLNFLGSVLYLAAHPDDENTRLISYYSNSVHARTAYLSLTRGDGGQNLIGTELREQLGVIRTQELLEARKIDGGIQYFSRANDFGYSKTPDETLKIWNKEEVLSDIVWVMRNFQPDVIINRFDARTPGTTHGHHTASALLSLEAFDLANDPTKFSSQISLVKPWQPKRAFFNVSYFFYGSPDAFEKVDKSNYSTISTGVYYNTFGKSNQEIAALSRSRHQSQGFGTTGSRGDDTDYLEFVKGSPIKSTNIFEGIDTTWNRVEGGKQIQTILEKVQREFSFKDPSLSVPELVKAYKLIKDLKDLHWKEVKSDEISSIILSCLGLYTESVTTVADSNPDNSIKITSEITNRSSIPVVLSSITTFPTQEKKTLNKTLYNNKQEKIVTDIALAQAPYSAPYYLNEKATEGMYYVADQKERGKPQAESSVKLQYNFLIDGIEISKIQEVAYKYNDPVTGEIFEKFDLIPAVSTSITEKVQIFTKKKMAVTVKVKAGKDKANGKLTLELPATWEVTPAEIPFSIALKGAEETFTFTVTPPKDQDEITAQAVVLMDGRRFDMEQTYIRYPHIAKQQVLQKAQAKFIKLDIKIGKQKVGYIMGAGDEVATSLSQMGYDVQILNPADISEESLAKFDVIITGIRAYNTIIELGLKQDLLLNFVNSGKTMIVQYNTLGKLVTDKIAPFPLKISRDRVTDENAKVTFLAPQHSILNFPNKITSKDFEGWTQEQGLYYPSQWDKAFTPIISSHDEGESPKDGAILVAKYGKGQYIYTGISFFRELPAGVSGAFKLMANMISIPY